MDITADSLMMRPIDTDRPRALLARALPLVGVPGAAVRLANTALGYTELLQPKVIPLNTIQSVVVMSSPGRLRPPATRVTFQNGERHDVGVLKGQLTPSFAPANQALRDRLLAALELRQT